jgi:hypothetical protein
MKKYGVKKGKKNAGGMNYVLTSTPNLLLYDFH